MRQRSKASDSIRRISGLFIGVISDGQRALQVADRVPQSRDGHAALARDNCQAVPAAVAEIRPLDLELLSPELVLVSPPELGDRARLALPDYEREFEEWIARTRAAFEAAQAIEQAEQQQLRRGDRK